MNIERLNPELPAAQALIAKFDEYMATVYQSGRSTLESIRLLTQPNVHFLGAFVDGKLIGCGAVKTLEDDGKYAEIKSVFVTEEHRGKGLSKPIMQALEKYLVATGISVARLATGVRQPTAISLYTSLGYVRRSPFGSYTADPFTIFMEKQLDA